jgi:hypothetical protein
VCGGSLRASSANPGQIGRLYQNAKKRGFPTSAPQKDTEISPLFKCDSATFSFYASKDGKITVSFSGWDASKVRYLRLVPIKLMFRGGSV